MKNRKLNVWKFVSAGLSVLIVFLLLFDVDVNFRFAKQLLGVMDVKEQVTDHELIAPAEGVVLAASFDDLGVRMLEKGVIDSGKIEQLYAQRGGLSQYQKALLYGDDNGRL